MIRNPLSTKNPSRQTVAPGIDQQSGDRQDHVHVGHERRADGHAPHPVEAVNLTQTPRRWGDGGRSSHGRGNGVHGAHLGAVGARDLGHGRLPQECVSFRTSWSDTVSPVLGGAQYGRRTRVRRRRRSRALFIGHMGANDDRLHVLAPPPIGCPCTSCETVPSSQRRGPVDPAPAVTGERGSGTAGVPDSPLAPPLTGWVRDYRRAPVRAPARRVPATKVKRGGSSTSVRRVGLGRPSHGVG